MRWRKTFPEAIKAGEAVKRYIKSIGKGLLKVMSKMGISTYQSYCGAQIFDAVGLAEAFVRQYFTGTASRIGGVGLAEIAQESASRHRDAFGDAPIYRSALDVGGNYALSHAGRDPFVDAAIRVAPAARGARHRQGCQERYREYAQLLNEQDDRLLTIRGLFRIKTAEEDGRVAVRSRRSRARRTSSSASQPAR